jgi:predicted GIY-YIG superfamily endonuclease
MAGSCYPPPDASGTIYLLHYSALTSQNRQHYLGFTGNLEQRFAQHRSGTGCRETSKAVAESVTLTVAQTWKGTPRLETRLKEWSREGRRGFSGICPLCGGRETLPKDLASELGPPSLSVGRVPAAGGVGAGRRVA